MISKSSVRVRAKTGMVMKNHREKPQAEMKALDEPMDRALKVAIEEALGAGLPPPHRRAL